jgi:hypothetical protein
MERDGAHVALELQRPLPSPRQQQKMPRRHDLMSGAPQHHAILEREQCGRQRAIAIACKRRDALRARGKLNQRDAAGIAARRGGVSGVERGCGGRLQGNSRQHVTPRLGAVVLGIGFT